MKEFPYLTELNRNSPSIASALLVACSFPLPEEPVHGSSQ